MCSLRVLSNLSQLIYTALTYCKYNQLAFCILRASTHSATERELMCTSLIKKLDAARENMKNFNGRQSEKNRT